MTNEVLSTENTNKGRKKNTVLCIQQYLKQNNKSRPNQLSIEHLERLYIEEGNQ
jgi:hypothetical protein